MDESPDHITAREFETFKDAVVNAISDSSANLNKRLDGIDRRFDSVQRTTNELLTISGQHSTKLSEHERRLNASGHRHARKEDPPTDNEPITVKDVKRLGWILSGIVAGITAILKGLPLLLKAIQP